MTRGIMISKIYMKKERKWLGHIILVNIDHFFVNGTLDKNLVSLKGLPKSPI